VTAHLSKEQRALAHRLHARGDSLRSIAKDICLVSPSHVSTILAGQKREGRVDDWSPRSGRLTLREREEIALGLRMSETFTAIAERLDRSISTISREVKENGGREDYRIWTAHCRAREQARRPKVPKLANPALCAKVASWLERLWSPQEIAQRLKIEYPGNKEMHVSHEVIYQSLFVQGRGELRRELARCLRSGRTQRRPHGRVERRGKIPNMVMISDRPAEVEDRAVPGHWEGDLIIGAGGKSAVGTLVERSTRYLLLLHLEEDHGAAAVEEAMRKAITSLPSELMRSVTWDQGAEMANHASLTLTTNVPIYFCDPHSPWQRGSNENTNGLLRQYMPKGTDLSVHSEEDLLNIQRSMNGRPRKTLGYMMPEEKLAELLALTP